MSADAPASKLCDSANRWCQPSWPALFPMGLRPHPTPGKTGHFFPVPAMAWPVCLPNSSGSLRLEEAALRGMGAGGPGRPGAGLGTGEQRERGAPHRRCTPPRTQFRARLRCRAGMPCPQEAPGSRSAHTPSQEWPTRLQERVCSGRNAEPPLQNDWGHTPTRGPARPERP